MEKEMIREKDTGHKAIPRLNLGAGMFGIIVLKEALWPIYSQTVGICTLVAPSLPFMGWGGRVCVMPSFLSFLIYYMGMMLPISQS